MGVVKISYKFDEETEKNQIESLVRAPRYKELLFEIYKEVFISEGNFLPKNKLTELFNDYGISDEDFNTF